MLRRVGDVVKFGLSTRLYLFGGPEELRPAEGLTKLQKRQLAALEVCPSDSAIRSTQIHVFQSYQDSVSKRYAYPVQVTYPQGVSAGSPDRVSVFWI